MNWVYRLSDRFLGWTYRRFPILAWLRLCQIAYQRCHQRPGIYRQPIHLEPFIDGLLLVNANQPIKPIRVFTVMRTREETRTEIAETETGWLKFSVTEDQAEKECQSLGIGWYSQELWLDSPSPYEPNAPCDIPTGVRA